METRLGGGHLTLRTERGLVLCGLQVPEQGPGGLPGGGGPCRASKGWTREGGRVLSMLTTADKSASPRGDLTLLPAPGLALCLAPFIDEETEAQRG